MTTARELRAIMDALDSTVLENHFRQADGDETPEPLVVCERVSVNAFDQYVGDGEGLCIGVCFLELSDDGRVLVMDFASAAHEATAHEFEWEFMAASGNDREIAMRGAMTAHRKGLPHKEADATYGPLARTLHRTAPPANRSCRDWLTLAVEVGHWQTWTSLEHSAQWWHGYDGIQYVLLIKVSEEGHSLHYRLHDVGLNPLLPTGALPEPVQFGEISHGSDGPANVTFDTCRMLSIPQGLPLPAGMHPEIIVNMRAVRDAVARALDFYDYRFDQLASEHNEILEIDEPQQALYTSPDAELQTLVHKSKALQPLLHQSTFVDVFRKFEPLDPRGICEEEFVVFCLEIADIAMLNGML